MALTVHQSDGLQVEASLGALLSSLLDPLVILDPTGRIVASNQAWSDVATTLGAPPARAGIGVHYLDVCRRATTNGDASAFHAMEGIESVLEGRRPTFSMQYICDVTATDARWYHMRVSRLVGHMEGALIVHEDITEAKQRIASLHEEIHHLNRVATLGQLAASATHQIRQPLTAIMCNVQTAIEICREDGNSHSELLELLADIVEADRVAIGVIEDYRKLLKRTPPVRVRMDLRQDVIATLLGIVRPTLAQFNISLHLDVDSFPLMVVGDRNEILQALLNLLVNAIEALQTSHAERRISLAANREDNEIVVDVSDNGSGIPEADHARIFNPFCSTKENGLGLGLAICRVLIQDNGGRIWLTTDPTKTTFSVAFPCAPAP